jgi:hypothetical protein
MSTKRIPIHRPIRAQIPLEALDLFCEMKNVKCTCPPIDWKGKYWERHECPGANAGGAYTRDTTLALADHPKPSRPMPLPGGVVCGSAVAAE